MLKLIGLFFAIPGLLGIASKSQAASNSIQGHIGGVSNQASSQVGDVPGNRYNGNFEFDYRSNIDTPSTKELEKRFTAAALVNDQNLLMYSFQEAYIGGNLTSKDHIRFGRQILPWSEVDKHWGLGKVNNRRNFDYFVPGQEGLAGLLYERKSTNGMRYRGFLSGLYIPESNPSLEIDKKDRTITSRHPWADVPVSSTVIDGVEYAVKYDVDYPKTSDVIYRYSVGANVGYESKHWVMDNFIMRKPENQISVDVRVIANPATEVVTASITPEFYYHDVYGSTLKYRNLDIEMHVSGIAIRPNTFPDVNEEAVRQTEIKTQKRREDYVGGGISKSNDLFTLAFNYVARLSPFDRLNDELSLDPRWNQAVNFFASRNFGQHYSLSGDIKYDMLTNDRLVMVRGTYLATRSLQMNVGVNMIGTPSNGKSYWSPFTNNDAIYGGLRYVF